MQYLLGIDIGTSSTKTLLTDLSGNPVAMDSKGYSISRAADDGVEQSPQLWWDGVCQTIRGVLKASGVSPDRIAGIGLSGQMHGMVALDRQGAVIRPAIIWMDARTKSLMDGLPVKRIAELTRNRPATGFLALSLKWMQEREPRLYEKIHTVLLPKDYIRYRLTGQLGTDYSDASGTTAFNPVTLDWSDEVLALLGFDRSLFPSCHSSWEIAGEVTGQAAAACGLRSGTPVVYGGGDNAMQNLGNGLVTTGLLSSNIGTAAQVATLSGHPLSDKDHRVNTFCYADRDLWSLVGASLSGGGVLSWLQKEILHSTDYTEMDCRAEQVPPCPDGLLFLPYLSGERSPYHDPSARGVLFGLNRSHTDAHMIRSVMEGIVLSLRCSLEVMEQLSLPIDGVLASGGGTRSSLWLQMQADIYNREIRVAEVQEQACLGAAVIAARGLGIYPTLCAACQAMVRLSPRRVAPIPDNVRRYDHYFPLFKELYQANQPLFRRIATPPA